MNASTDGIDWWDVVFVVVTFVVVVVCLWVLIYVVPA